MAALYTRTHVYCTVCVKYSMCLCYNGCCIYQQEVMSSSEMSVRSSVRESHDVKVQQLYTRMQKSCYTIVCDW